MQTTNPYQAPSTTAHNTGGPSPKLTPKQILFSFSGRIPRRTYWLWAIILSAAVLIPAAILSASIDSSGSEGPRTGVALGFLAIYVIAIWIGLALQVKRWHDRGKSGAWVLIGLIPVIGAIWAFVECGCLRGTFGPNNYGEDPT
jgi:uncharacterized membrane protein YhaH (DUF805 family)